MLSLRAAVLSLTFILIAGCSRKAAEQSKRPIATVTLDKEAVKLGDELQIRVENLQQAWSGELLVNSLRNFQFESKVYALKATVRNGFNEEGPTDLYVLLTGADRHQIPLANGGRLRVNVLRTAVKIRTETWNLTADGATRGVTVKASPGYKWSVRGAPDWVKINSGEQGTGDGEISYTVGENTTNEARTAKLTIGDAIFEITQLRPAVIQIPFYDTFRYTTPPAPLWMRVYKGKLSLSSSDRWVIDEPFGERSTLSIAAEAPKGGNSFLVKKQADPRSWSTMLVLPAVNVKERVTYKISTWMKAQNPGPVTIGFDQRTAPYGNCGLSHTFMVTNNWAEYAIPFRVTGDGCDATHNRLTIAAGQIRGSLWVANFSVVARDSPVHGTVTINPANRRAAPSGASGRLIVTAPPGYQWSVGGVPDWIKVTSGLQGAGSGTISYTVSENTSTEGRLAALTVGDATIEISQPCSPAIRIPYRDDFRQSAPPVPIWAQRPKTTGLESAVQWLIDEQPGQHSALSIITEAPQGGSSVLIERKADPRAWATQIVLPSLGVQLGQTYKVSLWMKTQKPGPVSIAFGQKAAPYKTCGLSHTFFVTGNWAEYTVPFRVTGNGCDAANNRLAIQAGQIDGKLWLANFSVARESPVHGAVTIDQPKRRVAASGASGRLVVTAPPGYQWSVGGVPDWIKITSGLQGAGSATMSYTVRENITNEGRLAALMVGDATVEISQPSPSAIRIPYHDDFRYSSTPVPIWAQPSKTTGLESAVQWMIDEQPGQHSALSIVAEAPHGGRSVVIERKADPRAWASQIILPSLGVQLGQTYKVSLWMKTQKPGPVSIAFGQKTAPYKSCGLWHTFPVTGNWAEYTVAFRVTGDGCDATNNRLSIQAGQIDGQLWLANFSVMPSF